MVVSCYRNVFLAKNGDVAWAMKSKTLWSVVSAV